MPPSVKPPIKQAAQDASNAAELQLIDLLSSIEGIVKEEKKRITGGVEPKGFIFDKTLVNQANLYDYSRDAVVTLKRIAESGLKKNAEFGIASLVDLLNYNYICSFGLKPDHIGKFVKTYEKELMEESFKKALSSGSHEEQQRWLAYVRNHIEDFEGRTARLGLKA